MEKDEKSYNYSNLSVLEHINMYIDLGYTSKDAIKMVAKERNLPKSEVYNEYHKSSRN